MPNLAFSPVGPQQPPLHDRGSGEKENANAASSPPVGSITKKAAVAPAGSTVVRSPLESLAAGTSIVCKRDSTCKCPDCDMAAAVFDINDLRQVGGGGGIPSSPTAGGIPPPSGVGGLARSPLAGGASRDVARDDHDGALPTWTPAPAGEGEGRQEAAVMPPKPAVAVVDSPAASPVPDSAASNVPHNAKKADMTATSSAPDGEHDAAVHKQPGESCGGASETAAGGETPAAASAKSAGSKKKGWGFRMARAVFSPLSPRRKQQGDAGGDGKSGTTAALAGELDDEATAAAAGAPPLVETTVELSATAERAAAAEPAAVPEPAAAAEPAAMSEPAATSEPAAAAELAPPADNEIPSSAGAGMGAGGKHGNTGAADGNDGNDDLLSGDESAQEEEEEGPVEHEDGDAAAAAIGGGTCKPPVPGNAAVAAGVSSSTSVPEDSNAAATGSAACGGMDVFLGERSAAAAAAARRASSGRRLSKDRYFECSSEVRRELSDQPRLSPRGKEATGGVEHVLASDSESDSGDKDVDPSSSKEQALESEQTSEQPAPPVNETNSDRISSSLAAAPSTPVTPAAATASSARASSATPMSLLPVVEADSPAAALEAAVAAAKAADVNGDVEPGGITVAADSAPSQKVLVRVAPGEETDVDVGAAAPADEATATQAATATYPPEGSGGEANAHDGKEKGAAQDEAQSQAGGARGLMGLGRRRNRRQGTQLELGMAEAYGHEDHRAKFSQAEVDAKIKERLAEEQSAFEKTVSGLKSTHEADLQAAADKLQQSSSDGNRAKIAARDAEALEREIAMLSERYGEAAAEAKHSGKILLEKEALLDAVTAQLMGLKSDLATTRAEHAAEKQRMTETADSERRARSLAESRLQQLEVAYNKLEDSEREKRAAGILKMKNDMKALAQQQFAGANKQHAALRARLERSEAQTRLLEEAAKEFNAKLETAGQKSTELSGQVEALQNEKVEAAASASRREHVLQQEATALRNDAESRLDEMEAMARERDAANSGRDVSQDALARMAIRNTQLKESVADLEGKVKELEGFCTEALDELDREKVKNAKRIFAEGGK